MLLDEVTRDYIPSVTSPSLARACCLLPWQPYSLLLDDPLWSGVEEFVSPPVTVWYVCYCTYTIHTVHTRTHAHYTHTHTHTHTYTRTHTTHTHSRAGR